MTSARCRLGKGSSAAGPWTWGSWDTAIVASGGQYIKVEPETLMGIATAAVSVTAADEVTWAAGLPSTSYSTAAKTATFQTATASTAGHCYTVQYQVNSGLDARGDTDASLTKTLEVSVQTPQGRDLVAVGEGYEHDRQYGHAGKLNDMIRGVNALASASADEFSTTATLSGSSGTLYSYELSANTMLAIRLVGVGVSCGGTAGAGYAMYRAYRRSGTASAAAVGLDNTATHEDVSLWALGFSVSGATVKVDAVTLGWTGTSWVVQGDRTIARI